jgi:uracil-DNA glycosylase
MHSLRIQRLSNQSENRRFRRNDCASSENVCLDRLRRVSNPLGTATGAAQMSKQRTKEPHGITLKELHNAEAECRRCPLYGPATQVVPGQGSASSHLMLVGEQPGREEDLQGLPFVGPAGRVLDRALEEAGIDRRRVFVTNAVKHFKFEQRGKRRLHKRPNTYEIERCRWWIDIEKAIIKPKVVVALGATAARSLLGKTVSISSLRGDVLTQPDGTRLIITIHPSYLLRINDAGDKAREYRRFVGDLKSSREAIWSA